MTEKDFILCRCRVGGGCWVWTGGRNRQGYGRVMIDGRSWLAHRLAWIVYRGPIPDGLCVCHSCDNPPCVNPDHLWLGTRADNNRDAIAKGRLKLKMGSERKLTADQVRAARAIYPRRRGRVGPSPDGPSISDLARSFGVGHRALLCAAAGDTYRDIK